MDYATCALYLTLMNFVEEIVIEKSGIRVWYWGSILQRRLLILSREIS